MKREIFKYFQKTFITALPVITVLIGVNYFGDGARLFDDKYEANMAEILIEGSNVTNVSNFDERVFQKELIIKNGQKDIDMLIVGSSRTMLINKQDFPNKSFFNSSVTGASIEDLIGICQLYKLENKLPKELLLGIDPWIFNINNAQNRWSSLGEEFTAFINENGSSFEVDIPYKNKYKELFSLSYFQTSLLQLSKRLLGNNAPVATDKYLNTSNTKIADGSLRYGKSYRNANNETIEKKVKKYLGGAIYGIENFDSLSIRNIKLFNSLITMLQKNEVRISFFIVPYHPLAYEKISKQYHPVLETENFIRKLSEENNIRIMGSFDPKISNLTSSDFYDAMHCKESGLKAILKQY